jgi:hypothetical protein
MMYTVENMAMLAGIRQNTGFQSSLILISPIAL